MVHQIRPRRLLCLTPVPAPAQRRRAAGNDPRGVGNGVLAYVGKTASGDYNPFLFKQALMHGDIEFSEEMFLISKETAEAYLEGSRPTRAAGASWGSTAGRSRQDGPTTTTTAAGKAQATSNSPSRRFHGLARSRRRSG